MTTSTGPYHLAIISSSSDVDGYAIQLRSGDVLGAATVGSPSKLTVVDPDGRDAQGSIGDASTLYPASSPLPHGHLSIDHIAVANGWHYVEVEGSGGSYQLTVVVHRPGLDGTSHVQTFYLDYDGAQVDPAIFASSGLPSPNPPGPRAFPPLRSFLAAWGLTSADDVSLEKAITATGNGTYSQSAAALQYAWRLALVPTRPICLAGPTSAGSSLATRLPTADCPPSASPSPSTRATSPPPRPPLCC
jgi:hypothetical protein